MDMFNLMITEDEKQQLLRALAIEKKSLERAAKAYELEGRKATADATRHELSALVKLTFKVSDSAGTKTPQSKP